MPSAPAPAPAAGDERVRKFSDGSQASRLGLGDDDEAGEQLAQLEPVFLNRPLQTMLDISSMVREEGGLGRGGWASGW